MDKLIQNRGKILWVDDEIDLLNSHILFLEKKGFTVKGVNSGEDALQVLQDTDFDIILLDEMMSGMDGLTALKEINTSYPEMPVIMITKNEEEWLMDEAIGYKTAQFLTKPVNPSQILIACKEVLESRQIQSDKTAEKYLQEFREIGTDVQSANSIDDWFSINNTFSDWVVRLDSMEDDSLRQIFQDQYIEANNQFTQFILDKYKNWLNIDSRPVLTRDIIKKYAHPKLKNNEKIVFIVMDCLGMNLWKTVMKDLYDYFKIETNFGLSLLPSTTLFSRNAIFSGLFPDELEKKYPSEWAKIFADEKSRNRYEDIFLQDQLKRLGHTDKSVKYAKIVTLNQGKKLESQINDFKHLDMLALVVNFVDILGHTRSESSVLQEMVPDEAAYRSAVVNWMKSGWFLKVLREISYWGHTVIITSDHGIIRVKKPVIVKGDKSTSSGIRSKFGRNLNLPSKQALVIKNPSDYRLPNFDGVTNYLIARGTNFFVYPNQYHQFVNVYENSFQHGGISMDEMIVPIGTLRGKTG